MEVQSHRVRVWGLGKQDMLREVSAYVYILFLKFLLSFCGCLWLDGYCNLSLGTLNNQISVAQWNLCWVGSLILFLGIHCFFCWVWASEPLGSRGSFRICSTMAPCWQVRVMRPVVQEERPRHWGRQGHYHGYSKAQNLTGCIVGVRRRQWHPTLVLLPRKSMDGGAW